MKKIILYLFICCAFSFQLNAQLAPDFTETDINGNSHNLYEYLDAGKVVILDVSATWCGPCWGLHQKHYLKYLHETYGPEGTGEVVVLFYEGDGDTTSDDLNGTGSSTLGDWVTDTPYPIIDPASVSNDFLNTYAPEGFPTVSVICPADKMIIADIWNESYGGMVNIIKNCNTLGEVKDANLTKYNGNPTSCGEAALAVEVLNAGTEDITELTVVAKDAMGNELGTVTVNETFSTGEVAEVEIGMLDLVNASEEVTFELTSTDDISTNNGKDVTLYLAPETKSTINVYIEADQYVASDPTSWDILDEEGNVVIEGETLTPSTTYENQFELPASGCYSFVMVDGYGDGNFGAVSITDSEGVIIYENAAFGSRGEGPFRAVAIANSTNEIELLSSLQTYPNPVTDRLTVEFALEERTDIQIELVNVLGQVVYVQKMGTLAADNYKEQIEMANLSTGIYQLNMISGNQLVSTKIIKE